MRIKKTLYCKVAELSSSYLESTDIPRVCFRAKWNNYYYHYYCFAREMLIAIKLRVKNVCFSLDVFVNPLLLDFSAEK